VSEGGIVNSVGGRLGAAAAISIWLLSSAMQVEAYDVIDVPHGGTVAGIVTLKGQTPAPKAFNLVTFPDPEYCGRISNGSGWRLLRDFSVDQESGLYGLKDVIVLLEGIEAGKPFDLSVPRIEARDCQFNPFVTVVRDQHAVEVVNMDPVMHDIQAYETSRELGARVLFNSPLPMNVHHERGNLHAAHRHLPGKSMLENIHLTKGRRFFVMQCGFHAYMESWAVAVSNPYYEITDKTGSFAIQNVPPGTYRLIAWHPYVGTVAERMVTVEPKGLTRENLTLPAPVGRRSSYEVMDPPRFGPEALGRPLKIEPLVEQQH
jgi:hypothetical protein